MLAEKPHLNLSLITQAALLMVLSRPNIEKYFTMRGNISSLPWKIANGNRRIVDKLLQRRMQSRRSTLEAQRAREEGEQKP